MADQVEIGILLKAVDEASATLNNAGESIKTLGAKATEAAGATVDASEAMGSSMEHVGPSCDLATHALVEHGREVKAATKEYKLANIEQMQYNQILQMTGQTCIQWGTTLQGSHDLAKKSISGFMDTLDRATAGFTTYLGAGVQVVGMIVNAYAQYDRMVLMWGMHTTAVAADGLALDANTASAGFAATAQAALNAVMDLNPYVLMGAAVGAIAIAAGAVILAYDNWTTSNEDLDKAAIKLSTDLDMAWDKMRRLYSGEDTSTKSLQDQADGLYVKYNELADKKKAAEELGYTDKAKDIDEQMNGIYQDRLLLLQEIEVQKRHGAPQAEVLAGEADLLAKLTDGYIKAAEKRGDFWVQGGQDCASFFDYKAAAEAADAWGEKVIMAYAEAMKRKASSAECQKIIDDAMAEVGADMESHSAPKRGPLKDVEIWGQQLAKTYGKGIASGVPDMTASANQLSSALAGGIPKGGSSGSSPGDFGLGGVSAPGFTVIQNIYHADEDKIARRVIDALRGSLI